MSLEELEQAGILLPREKWGKRKLKTGVARGPLAVVAALFPVSAALMYLGDGRGLTWVGLVLFLVILVAFTWLSLRGIGVTKK